MAIQAYTIEPWSRSGDSLSKTTHQFERTVYRTSKKKPSELSKTICCLSIIQESRFGGSPINRSQLIRRNNRNAQMSSSNFLDCFHHAHSNFLTNLPGVSPPSILSGCRTFTPKELQWRHWKLSLHTQESLLKPKKIVQKNFIIQIYLFGLPSLHFRFGVPFFVCWFVSPTPKNPTNPTTKKPHDRPTSRCGFTPLDCRGSSLKRLSNDQSTYRHVRYPHEK